MYTATAEPNVLDHGLGVGLVNVYSARLSGLTSPPNPNAGLNQFVRASVDGSSSFDVVAWQSAAKANAAWNDVAWSDVAWSDVAWADVAWADAAWASAAWGDVAWSDVAWSDVAWSDAAWADNSAADAAGQRVDLAPGERARAAAALLP